MSATSAMAWVPAADLLAKVSPFLEHYEKRKAEYKEARADYIAFTRRGFDYESISFRVNSAYEISAICKEAVDGKVYLSARDVRFIETLDPADVDLAINRYRDMAARRRADREADNAAASEALTRADQRRRRNLVIVASICLVVAAAILGAIAS